jgi:N-acylneuraminate cytidylyltransferase
MNICVIPARGGSKRIKKKNIKLFLGKPIISYSIQTALKSQCFDMVLVSTDDVEIKDIAIKYGAKVPFLRSKSISDDYTPINEVIKDSISWLIDNGYKVDNVCCLYATSPFAQADSISKGLRSLLSSRKSFSVAVTEFNYPVQRAVRIIDKVSIEPMFPKFISMRSQDLEQSFHDAGQFYWGTLSAILNDIDVLSTNSTFVTIPSYMVQDIDTLDDWKRAELMFKVLYQN